MFIAALIVSVLLALLLVSSAISKLRGAESSLSVLDTVRWPRDRAWILAVVELVGAAGLVIGLLWWPLGVAAAAGVIVYFVGALVAHLLARDPRGAVSPIVPLALAIAALVLRLLSA